MVVSGYTNMQDKQANLAVSLHWLSQATCMFIFFSPSIPESILFVH